ncbi:MAG: hypothetical protein L6407_05815 [Candidatus Delongbacteria bacterium]|nr:hypothetical protein [Candidatus Delongbacteria bacterium]
MTAKYEVSRIVIKEKLISEGFINPKNFKLTIIFISFCLILFFPIQDYIGAFEFRKYYYGKIVPNVWHNSTTIFLFPFAMLLFWKQYKELKSGTPVSNSSLVTLSMLVVLNILIKPSFFIVFAPITILFLYIRYKISAEFTKNLIPIFIGLFLLYFMHRVTYILQLGSYNKSEGSITFSKPFEAWTYFAPGWYLPISFVHSYALPIFYMIFYWKESVRNNKLFQFTLSMTVLGLLISILVIENGPRKFHGNFMWQNVICTYILMLIVSCDLIKKYLEEGLKSIKLRTLIIVFFLHAISGIIYIIKIFVTKSPA